MKAGTLGLVSAAAFVVALSIVMSGCGASSEDVSNTSSQGPTPSPTYKKGTVPVPVGPPNPAAIANAQLSPPPVPTCGSWSAADGSLGSVVQARYGEERNCGFFDGYWVITTLGLKNTDGARGAGVIAIGQCGLTDAACLDGNTDHPYSTWTFIQLPEPGGTIEGHPAPNVLMLPGGLFFDLATREFSRGWPSAVPTPLGWPGG
jgi:hypothetical protein